MGRECSEVFDVASEHDATRFRNGNDDGVHCRTALGKVAQLARATSKGGGQVLPDIASLEQTIHCCVIALATRGRLGEDHGRNQWWPGASSNQCADGGDGILVSLGKEAHSPGVQDEHRQLALGASAFVPCKR